MAENKWWKRWTKADSGIAFFERLGWLLWGGGGGAMTSITAGVLWGIGWVEVLWPALVVSGILGALLGLLFGSIAQRHLSPLNERLQALEDKASNEDPESKVVIKDGVLELSDPKAAIIPTITESLAGITFFETQVAANNVRGLDRELESVRTAWVAFESGYHLANNLSDAAVAKIREMVVLHPSSQIIRERTVDHPERTATFLSAIEDATRRVQAAGGRVYWSEGPLLNVIIGNPGSGDAWVRFQAPLPFNRTREWPNIIATKSQRPEFFDRLNATYIEVRHKAKKQPDQKEFQRRQALLDVLQSEGVQGHHMKDGIIAADPDLVSKKWLTEQLGQRAELWFKRPDKPEFNY